MNIFFGVLLILLGILIMRFNAKKQTEKANYTINPNDSSGSLYNSNWNYCSRHISSYLIIDDHENP